MKHWGIAIATLFAPWVARAQPPNQAPPVVRGVAMAPVRIDLFADAVPAARGLDLDPRPVGKGVEEITVFAPVTRHRPAAAVGEVRPLWLGGVTFTSSMDTSRPGSEVLTVTAALPVAGVPGLDLVAHLQAIRRTNDLAYDPVPFNSSAPPVGFRLSF